ncbi:MAG: serine/threonine protein kinase [Planctomycetota bacterium]|nr:MAG: serine/threonine protein kinase [Planctomycetota bacterium]
MNRHRMFAFCVCVWSSLIAVAEDWPQFRGINASGVTMSKKPLPTEFSLEKNLRWSAKLGDGVGCPIVASGKVITTAMTAERTFSVFAFEAATGKKLWQRDFETGKLPRITPPNSHASSTPASDGKQVYVYCSTLGLIALDAMNGDEKWKRSLPSPSYLMDWGAASSPIVHDGTVFFNQDDDLSPVLFAVDAKSGAMKWTAERPDMLGGYAVPVICEANGQTDVVISGSGFLKGYDPATGTERWSSNSTLRTMMSSPVVRDGIIYLSSQSYGDEKRTLKFALLEWLDTNQDGKLTKAEIPKEFASRFDTSDKDGDGVIADGELDTAFQSAKNQAGGGNTIQAVRGGGRGDVTKTHVLWNIANKSPSNIVSPVVVGEQLFIVKKGGLSSSFDATTGKTHWELNRIRNIGDYYASPVAGDGKIFVTGENGFIVVLEQGPKLKVLATNDVGESCVATPAIADGRLFVRGRETLFCFGEDEK